VSDHDSLGVHEHLFHEQSYDSLSLLDRACFGAIPEAPKELLKVLRQRNVRFLIEGFCLQCIELCAKRGLLLAKVGHAGAKLFERHQLLLVRFHQSGLRSRTATEFKLQPGLLCRDGIRCSQITETSVDFSADQSGVRHELHDVAPNEILEIVLSHGTAGAHASVLIAVVIGAQASVIVKPSLSGARRDSVVAVAATRTGHESLEE
jgi:hypothetical protein